MDDDGKKPPRGRFDKPRAGKVDGRPRENGPARPGGRKPYSPGTPKSAEVRPPRKFGPPDGKKPFRPRERADAVPDRPKRESDRPAGQVSRPPRGDKPFRPRPDDGPRKPYVARTQRPARDGENTTPRSERPRRPAEGHRGAAAGADRERGRAPRETQDNGEAPGERIAKRLARAGIASRRDAEALVADGRVKVNGKVLASPAFNVMPEDEIQLDNAPIPAIERTRLFLFHKPAGLVTTNRDPEGRKTVFDALPADLPRLMTVGRLDINTEGLLLLTNDGGLARVLELPATGWLRRYRVRVHGKVDPDALPPLKDGMAVGGVFYGSIEATLDSEKGANAWMTIGLREGKNREVKNILGALGLEVTRLIRLSYGPFQLGDLPEGHVHELKGRALRDQLGERLIEEAGANFEAPVARPFTNKPAMREEPSAEEPAKSVRDGERGRVGDGGLIKKRRFDRDDRDHALGRLSTKDPRGKPARAGKPGERAKAPIDPPSQRKANVWMAPGARPVTRKDDAAPSPDARKPRTGRAGGNESAGRPPRKGKDDAGRRR